MLMMRPHLFLEHRRERQPGGVKCRRQVDGEDQVPLFGREILQRGHMLDSGIVDQDIEPSMRTQCVIDHLADRHGLRHIRGRVGHPDIELRGDLGLHIRNAARIAETVEDDFGAGGGKRAGDAQADPTRGARHQGHLPQQAPSGIAIFRLDGDVHGLKPPGRGWIPGRSSAPICRNSPRQRQYRLTNVSIESRYGHHSLPALRPYLSVVAGGRILPWRCTKSDISWRRSAS
jgi:hypothetical protein